MPGPPSGVTSARSAGRGAPSAGRRRGTAVSPRATGRGPSRARGRGTSWAHLPGRHPATIRPRPRRHGWSSGAMRTVSPGSSAPSREKASRTGSPRPRRRATRVPRRSVRPRTGRLPVEPEDPASRCSRTRRPAPASDAVTPGARCSGTSIRWRPEPSKASVIVSAWVRWSSTIVRTGRDGRREALVAGVRPAEDVGLGAGLETAHGRPGVVLEVPEQAGLEPVDLLAVDLRRIVVGRRAEQVALLRRQPCRRTRRSQTRGERRRVPPRTRGSRCGRVRRAPPAQPDHSR